MKAIATALCAFACAALPVRAWVYETPFEFITEADLDGDGRSDVVIVDKETGAFRVGYQASVGTPAWADARAGGIDNVTGVSWGRVLNTTRDTLVLTGPAANRINLVEAIDATAPALPVSVFIPSLGPSLAAAVDIGGVGNTAHADLYIASRENPGPRETLVRNTGVARSVIADSGLAQYRGSPNVFVLRQGQPSQLGLFNRVASPGQDQFVVVDLSSGAAATTLTQPLSLANTPRQPQFVSSRFNSADSYAQVLFYQPGASNILKYQVQGAYSLTGSNSFPMGNAIQQVEVLTSVTGPRLLVLFGDTPTNATVATVYSFDGVNPPVAVQSFTNAAGFTGAGALGFGNFSLMVGDGSGRSSKFQNIGASGGAYTNGTSGDLPKVSPYSGSANVMMFAGEPFVLSTAKALKNLRAGDWSSAPVLSGAPLSLTVKSEHYANPTNGLSNPGSTVLGVAPSGTTYALVNQYTNPISIFPRRAAIGDTAADVTISPVAGEYIEAIKLIITVNTTGWSIKYRLANGAAWQTYLGPVTLFSNATVQFYGFDPVSTAKTPVRSAAYTFTLPAGGIDSDHDGVPDAVEVAKGIDPKKGADSDGDGYSDLEELIRGTNPLNNLDAPTNFPPADFKQAFDLYTTPRVIDNTFALSLSTTGVAVRVFGLDGRAVAQATTTNDPAAPAGVTNPAAQIKLVQPIEGEVLLAQGTDPHFDLNVSGDPHIGREHVGIVPIPPLTLPALPPVDLSLGAGAANAWISTVANIITNLPRTKIIRDLTYRDTLAGVLFEEAIADILVARGTNYGTNLTLFPFRAADAGRSHTTGGDLLSIESWASPSLPAYRLTNAFAHIANQLRTNSSPGLTQLRNLAASIYQISAASNNLNPSVLKLTVDELRYFLENRTWDTGYRACSNSLVPAIDFTAAWFAASNLLATLPPRPTTNVIIECVTAGPDIPTTFRLVGGGPLVTLWQKDGAPCALPPAFALIPGSQLTLFGHTDIAPAGSAGTMPVEVISISFASVPVASDGDANGDLLIDSWENLFLGGGIQDAFGDADGDGYTNLQEMLAGTDPSSTANMPGGPAALFHPPALNLVLNGSVSQGSLTFQWPAAFIGNFHFGVRASSTIDGGFADLAVGPPVSLGGDNFTLQFNLPAVQNQFFILTVGLNQ